jgi:aspartate racemase
VHSVIYQELCRGLFTDSSRAQIRGVIGDLVASGAEGIILGCTEIELLISATDSPVPVLPTTLLHAVAGLDASLGSAVDVEAWVTGVRPHSALGRSALI